MEIVQQIIVGVFAISVMLSVGVDLTLDRIWVVFRRPKVLIIGLLLNHLAVPFIAFGIAEAFALSATVATGFLLCAAAPGGPLGAMFTQRAKGDIAFAASLLVVMTAVNTISTPILVGLLLGAELEGGFFAHGPAIVQTILLYLLLPLGLGIGFRYRWPKAADRALPMIKLFTNLVFLALFVGLVAVRWRLVFQVGLTPLLAMLLCVLISVIAGYVLAGGKRDLRVALGLNTGIRNISLSLLLATMWFGDDSTLLTIVTYGVIQIVVSLLATAYLRSRG